MRQLSDVPSLRKSPSHRVSGAPFFLSPGTITGVRREGRARTVNSSPRDLPGGGEGTLRTGFAGKKIPGDGNGLSCRFLQIFSSIPISGFRKPPLPLAILGARHFRCYGPAPLKSAARVRENGGIAIVREVAIKAYSSTPARPPPSAILSFPSLLVNVSPCFILARVQSRSPRSEILRIDRNDFRNAARRAPKPRRRKR